MKPAERHTVFGGSFLFLLLIFILSSSTSKDRFQEVLNTVQDESVKSKLLAFREGGIEKSVEKEYDVDDVIEFAKTFLNTPYKMGGTTKEGMDCSGLVMVSHANSGINLPHSSNEQARYGEIIAAKSELKKGDLVFFYKTYHSRQIITHSGIYLGNGEFIHTSNSKGVSISTVDDPYYWGERFLFGTRLFSSK